MRKLKKLIQCHGTIKDKKAFNSYFVYRNTTKGKLITAGGANNTQQILQAQITQRLKLYKLKNTQNFRDACAGFIYTSYSEFVHINRSVMMLSDDLHLEIGSLLIKNIDTYKYVTQLKQQITILQQAKLLYIANQQFLDGITIQLKRLPKNVAMPKQGIQIWKKLISNTINNKKWVTMWMSMQQYLIRWNNKLAQFEQKQMQLQKKRKQIYSNQTFEEIINARRTIEHIRLAAIIQKPSGKHRNILLSKKHKKQLLKQHNELLQKFIQFQLNILALAQKYTNHFPKPIRQINPHNVQNPANAYNEQQKNKLTPSTQKPTVMAVDIPPLVLPSQPSQPSQPLLLTPPPLSQLSQPPPSQPLLLTPPSPSTPSKQKPKIIVIDIPQTTPVPNTQQQKKVNTISTIHKVSVATECTHYHKKPNECINANCQMNKLLICSKRAPQMQKSNEYYYQRMKTKKWYKDWIASRVSRATQMWQQFTYLRDEWIQIIHSLDAVKKNCIKQNPKLKKLFTHFTEKFIIRTFTQCLPTNFDVHTSQINEPTYFTFKNALLAANAVLAKTLVQINQLCATDDSTHFTIPTPRFVFETVFGPNFPEDMLKW